MWHIYTECSIICAYRIEMYVRGKDSAPLFLLRKKSGVALSLGLVITRQRALEEYSHPSADLLQLDFPRSLKVLGFRCMRRTLHILTLFVDRTFLTHTRSCLGLKLKYLRYRI